MDFNNKILPRFENATTSEYTTTSYIQTHASHLLGKQVSLYRGEEGNEQEQKQSKKLYAPVVQLVGHGSEVNSVKFSPNGNQLASAGSDKLIFIWDIYNDCRNSYVFKGHTNSIVDLHWSTDGQKLYTASSDKTLGIWDVESQKLIKKMKGHTSYVNSCHPARRGPDLVVSGSDDGSVRIWDVRQRGPAQYYEDKSPITAVSFNDTSEKIFYGGLDNQIKCFDLRKKAIDYSLLGHTDTITSLSLSPDGQYLLSNAMDQTLRCWDIKPFVVKNRCVKTFIGNRHTHEKILLKCAWNIDGSQIAGGSSDRYLYIWDSGTKKVIHKLDGHQGSVNEVVFSPIDNMTASCSHDRTIILGYIPNVKYQN